jgi:selenocysteine-specific elongation factor
VVTGTALSGEIKATDRVRCLPGNQLFRVRSLQVHGKSVETAGWGQRVALNLTGPERADVTRGHVICHEKLTLTSDRFDAFLEVRPAATKGIKNHQRVRVHLGTTERLAKIILLEAKDKVEPKTSTYCQITLAEPVMALRGDHFIVRDETARRTLAGGVVLHPWARAHKRNEPGLQARLEFLHSGDLAHLTQAFIEESPEFAVSLEPIYQFLNLQEDETRERIGQMKSLRVINAEGERVYTTEAKWQRLKEIIIKTLRDFHGSHPLVPGMDMEELRGKLTFELSPKVFRPLVETFIAEKIIAKEENLLRLTEHRVQLGSQEKTLMERIKKILGEQPLTPPDLKDLEKQLGASRNKLTEVVRLLERDGSVIRVATDLYYLSSAIDQVRAVLKKFLSEKSEITAASFRDLINSSRKYTIPLLEYFDREGTTIRIGDIRRLKAGVALEKQSSTR